MAAAIFLRTLKRHRVLPTVLINRYPPLISSLASSSTTTEVVSPPTPPSSSSAAAAASFGGESKSGAWSKAFLFLPGAITFGLGTWQLIRRQEKIEMIEYRRNRLAMEPIMWNNFSGGDMSSLEFRKVICEGQFDESKNIYVGPRSRSISGVTENGYYVITPLLPASNNSKSEQVPVLVNRGWVPREWRNRPLRNPTKVDFEEKAGRSWWEFWSRKPKTVEIEESIVAPIKVLGVIRGSENPSIFVPENDPCGGQWFYVNIPMIAHASGLPENTNYIEDINENIKASNPYPLPKDVNTLIRHSVMPQDHLNYTLTWYTLSAAVTFMASKRIRTSKSRR